MKHVGTAAPTRRSQLVTAFGAFPGAPVNPTQAILAALEAHRPSLARSGIDLALLLMPVVYGQIDPLLAAAVATHRPDAILHLGLATRRGRLCVETRAINRVSLRHPDSSGALPTQPLLDRHGPPALPATYPAKRILESLRREGLKAALSRSAGDYVCNATLHHSLRAALAPSVGFLHVPPARISASETGDRPTIADLTRAVLAAIHVMADADPENDSSRAAATISPPGSRSRLVASRD